MGAVVAVEASRISVFLAVPWYDKAHSEEYIQHLDSSRP